MIALRSVVFGWLLILALAGCAMPNGYYQPATVSGDIISNPKVGWRGYSVKVPEGLEVFNPAEVDPNSTDLTTLQKWCITDDERYSRAMAVTYSERFLLEDLEGRGYILFASDTLGLAPWSTWLSPDKEYFLQKSVNDKRVRINDDKAHNELVTLNGQRGWYISGTARTYSKNKYQPQAYEGYFILGNLKEVFWVEGWAPLNQREFLKKKTRKMVESLKIK